MSAGPPVDPRGPRLAAWITTVVLAVALVTQWWPLLAVQTVIFAIGAFVGLKHAPYSLVYRYLVAPRLKPTDEREDAAPLRFAQGVGFAFAAVATIAFAVGLTVLGVVATAFALVAAFLNAAFGLCLGCESYLLLRRFTTSRPSVNPTT
jgi:disulfide bond formation protein DsbB